MRSLNPNRFAQIFMESAMEMLRREIIGQEHIFRSQVRELHRLYWTQKNLMNELRMNGINAHTSKEKNAMSEPSRDRKGGNVLDWNVGALLKNHSRVFNLQLPVFDFIHGTETGLSKSERIFHNDCGIGEVVIEKGPGASDSFRCIEVIDLENCMDVVFHEANESCDTGFRTSVREASTLFGSQSRMMGDNKYCLPSVVHSDEKQDRRLHGHVSCVGLGHSNEAAVNDLSSNKHGSRPLLIDLNLPNEDECYHTQNDHIVKIASPCTNFSIHHYQNLELEPRKSNTDKASFTSKPDPDNPASVISCKYRADWLIPLNQELLAHGYHDSMVAHNNSKDNSANANGVVNTRLSSVYQEDSVDLSQTISRDPADKPRNHDQSEEDTLSSDSAAQDDAQPDEFHRKLCAEYSCNGIINNSECSSHEKSSEGPATLSITDDSVITQIHSPKHEFSYTGKSKVEGNDVAIAAAAEALMTITFGRSELFENSMEAVEVRCDEPQSSSDSFELMAMQLPEVRNEEHVLVGEISRFNETRKDENVIRLQRGRRLRDFRKDILPGLVSLSRHEIWEDLYNIGYCLRKNEPKSARENWFLQVRNKRSRKYFGR